MPPPVRAALARFVPTALLAGLPLAAMAQANPVLIDLYRGQGYVPTRITPDYNNNVGADGRLAAVQRLAAFAASNAAAVATAGTSLPASLSSLNIPNGANVLCESATGTTSACVNAIQGAQMYTAVLFPTVGTYYVGFPNASAGACNDGAIVDVSATQGTAYRALPYTAVKAGCSFTDTTYGTQFINVTQPNTLLNLRVTWNNWGNDAAFNLGFAPSSGGPLSLMSTRLYDPNAPATYLTAANDDFSATPIQAGATAASPSVFGNDRVNVATPVSASNVQTMRLINPPAGITLNPDGTLRVGAQAPGGSQTLTYEICRTDTQPNPLCAQATVSLNILAAPAAAGGGVAAVPTLGQWALAIMGLLLGFAGLRALHGRR